MMNKRNTLLLIILLLINSVPMSYSISSSDLRNICRRTSNYHKCIRDFKKHIDTPTNEIESTSPIPIKVIPYSQY